MEEGSDGRGERFWVDMRSPDYEMRCLRSYGMRGIMDMPFNDYRGWSLAGIWIGLDVSFLLFPLLPCSAGKRDMGIRFVGM